MTGQAFSEVGKRNFGRPTCITIAASIVLGTSKGIILVFDYSQNLKSIIGQGTKAAECGSITSISISADHSTIAAGHVTGHIFTWEVAKSAKPFLHIPSVDRTRTPGADGHVSDVAILHIGFLGKRHTALASADDHGMAFSHLATRGMGVVTRSVKTTRVLGRYPDNSSNAARQSKPSSVLSFSPLPFGNATHVTDAMGLVALLTPYLLVIVSTTPIAQTQYKAPRPKEVAAHGAMTAALAWFPSVKLKAKDSVPTEASRVKLVYCWSNILTVLDIVEAEPSASGAKEEQFNLQFKPRSRWKAEEAIVGVQWLGRSVLAVLTITQQLVILEDPSMVVTDSSDLIRKHIYHADLFSPQLNHLVDRLEDEEVAAMHGVVADAFYMSFRAYKGRLFLLGYNEISFGTLSNWADRLLALMEEGSYISAIRLATSYYSGEANKVAVGLPEDDTQRHSLVQEKLTEMMSASLKYTFNRNRQTKIEEVARRELEDLASACITACNAMEDDDFLFEDVFDHYDEAGLRDVFFECLEPYIVNDDNTFIPPAVIKDLVNHYTSRGLNGRLEEMICHLDSKTVDIDQITTLCRKNYLYDALLHVWNQALSDYTTILDELLNIAKRQTNHQSEVDPVQQESELTSATKIFPYLSYILTDRIYPTGKAMSDDSGTLAKADIYNFFFSGDSREPDTSNGDFGNLRRILDYDAASFLSMLNEAFEDSFLNGPQDRLIDEVPSRLTEEQKSGLSVNRQLVVDILLEVMTPPKYQADDIIYLDMFIARNLPKFQQFILLPGRVLHRALVDLCQYPSEDVADDCQLSVEYLLSMYQPPDMSSLIPLISKARFYRVLKSIYKVENQYANLLKTCFEDYNNTDTVFECISDCLDPAAGLSAEQITSVRNVIVEHAYDLIAADVKKAAAIIDRYAPDLHSVVLETVHDDEDTQFQYLQMALEPPTLGASTGKPRVRNPDFVEQYVRLMCKYNPSHVNTYIEHLDNNDLRLDEVLPALENSRIVDAAVVLMAREGKVREGIDRLTQHLRTLESIIIGLFDDSSNNPDTTNTEETSQDLINSIHKYTRIGVWLCQRQTKGAQERKPRLARAKSAKSLDESLAPHEELWLDLIDAVVSVTKNASEVLERFKGQAEGEDDETVQKALDPSQPEPSKMTVDLRTTVQETFTALLTATSAPHTEVEQRSDVSFLRILRSFLHRASLSSPSLANLRAVLGAIFSAYSYEQSLLSLANRLLDQELFVQVNEADTLRRRGWRPLGLVCELCRQRIWGPGAGGHIWEAWQRQNEERGRTDGDSMGSRPPSQEGKGKAVRRRSEQSKTAQKSRRGHETSDDDDNENDGADEDGGGRGPAVIFSCRHLFHRVCLEKRQRQRQTEATAAEEGKGAGIADGADSDLRCPLCTAT